MSACPFSLVEVTVPFHPFFTYPLRICLQKVVSLESLDEIPPRGGGEILWYGHQVESCLAPMTWQCLLYCF